MGTSESWQIESGALLMWGILMAEKLKGDPGRSTSGKETSEIIFCLFPVLVEQEGGATEDNGRIEVNMLQIPEIFDWRGQLVNYQEEGAINYQLMPQWHQELT